MTKYTAEIGGAAWAQGPVATFATITAARAWAEEYGAAADWCIITDNKGKAIASHRRQGDDWYRANI